MVEELVLEEKLLVAIHQATNHHQFQEVLVVLKVLALVVVSVLVVLDIVLVVLATVLVVVVLVLILLLQLSIALTQTKMDVLMLENSKTSSKVAFKRLIPSIFFFAFPLLYNFSLRILFYHTAFC
jgi:uncharacterized membrane protein